MGVLERIAEIENEVRFLRGSKFWLLTRLLKN